MKHFVGIDISKQDFHFCVLNKDWETVSSGNYPMSSEGFSKLLNLLSSLTEPVVVMESSGRFHIPLYYFLLSHNTDVYLINPKLIHRFFQFISANNPSKADKKDAKILAQKLKCELSATKTQIKYALSVLFPEAEKHFNIFSHTFLQILLKYPSTFCRQANMKKGTAGI